METKTLYLECRGCYFFDYDKISSVSDVGNYRVGVYKNRIHAKDGRAYILEFGGYDRKEMRYTNLRTGKPLKNPKCEVVQVNALHISTEFEEPDEKGRPSSWGNVKLEREIGKKGYFFTKADILRAVNDLSVDRYSKIVLLPDENLIPVIPKLRRLGGFRENVILDGLSEVRTKQYTKDYHVYTFVAENGESFDYEAISDRITG